ncbi:hypothetical protein [Granulicella aggregans]|jgi:hypothetical protein|uniref:hypothetical protein n=1 Tax=Granulicella aggregans TaxID=474949 RepID=UPI0021DFCB62|nr:hypothetical protein [Granulicella aggregans]
MQISSRPLQIFTRVAAVAVFAGSATLGLHAQQATSAAQSIFFVAPQTTQSLIAANDAPAEIGYSTSAGAEETADAVGYIANPTPQPPPRRYGRRPVYADSSHNADGSAKYTFFGGAGVTLPTGGTHAYFSPSYDFQVGGGRNFNKKFAALIEFDWHNFGIQTNTLNNLLAIYNGENVQAGLPEVGGHAHIWSFTVGPQYTFFQADKFGSYVIGGVGFYHKVTDFTTPETGEYCDPYYGCYEYQANATIDDYTSNAFGVNGGVGFTYKLSRFSDLKFYGEARYVYTANSSRPYYDGTTGTSLSATYFNVFPQNSAKTTYIPLTFGVRF